MEALSQVIGNTSLVRLDAFSTYVDACVYAKCEMRNPGGSIKDRAALNMIDEAEKKGLISPQKTTIIEPTSGNTGLALAMIGAVRNYKVILTMPESMSKERRMLLAAYGAQLVLTPAGEGMAGAVGRAENLAKTIPGAWIPGQFTNPANPAAHEKHTAPEIHTDLGAAPDYVVAGVGTGGTISGVAHYFKSLQASTKCFAVEPAESPLIAQKLGGNSLTPGSHGIQGIGANFIPDTLDLAAIAGVLSITTQAAIEAARVCARTEGLLVGISSGANLAAVKHLVDFYPEARQKTIVTFLVDTGERYLSTTLFEQP